MKIKSVSINEVEYTAHRLAVKFMTWDEPIPSFGSRFPNILEIGKGAILFYLMTKNHPFENGNKRIAVMTLLLFLYKNGKWLNINNQQIYRVALGVAKSKPKSKDLIISWVENELKNHLINYLKN